MTIVVADTSALLAIADRKDPEHQATQAGAAQAGALVVSALVLTETDHLARRLGRIEREKLLDGIIREANASRVLIPTITHEQLSMARAVMNKYHDLDLDLTDAVSVVLAAHYATDTILSLDRRDFRAMRPLTNHDHYRLLPDDL